MKRSKNNSRRIKRLERKTVSGSTVVNAFLGSSGVVGVSSFLELSDTPTSYTGESLKAVRVNAGETALEFYTPSAGGLTGSGTTNEIAYFTGATSLASLTTATYPSLTELSYVKGVTSSIQTQFTGKLNTGLAWLLASGGTLTATNTLSGSFGIGFGSTPNANNKFRVTGLGTTTGELLLCENSTGTERFKILDNGKQTITNVISGTDTGITISQGSTSTANNQVHSIISATNTITTGGFSGQVTEMRYASNVGIRKVISYTGTNPSSFTVTASNPDVYVDATGSTSTYIYAFRRNGVTGLQQGQNGVVRLLPAMNMGTNDSVGITPSHAASSGSTTHYVLGVKPTYNYTGTFTGTVYGIDYDPTLTSTTGLTNIAFRATSGSVLIGTTALGATTTRLQVRGIGTTTGNLALFEDSSGTARLTLLDNGNLTTSGDVTIADGKNIILNTTTGTKIGTSTTQKLGFFNATPVVRPSAYTPTNVITDRSYDANATTLDEVADVLGTLIADLQSLGLIG